MKLRRSTPLTSQPITMVHRTQASPAFRGIHYPPPPAYTPPSYTSRVEGGVGVRVCGFEPTYDRLVSFYSSRALSPSSSSSSSSSPTTSSTCTGVSPSSLASQSPRYSARRPTTRPTTRPAARPTTGATSDGCSSVASSSADEASSTDSRDGDLSSSPCPPPSSSPSPASASTTTSPTSSSSPCCLMDTDHSVSPCFVSCPANLSRRHNHMHSIAYRRRCQRRQLQPDCKPELHEVKRLRTLLPQSYFQIVSSVLSQMLDLSGTGHGILKQIDTLINSEGKALDPGIDELSLKAIQLLLNYFETNDDALKAEGLFRKAGCVNRMKVLTKLLSSGSDGDIKECITTCSPHDISNLLKRYLSKFTDKLCGDYLYHSHIEMIDLKYNQRLTTLQLLMQLIPTLKLDLLSRFAVILHRVAASPGNLMSTSALATIVTPVVLVPEGFENELLDENAAKACSFIIENAYKLKHIPSKMVKLVLNAWVAVDGDEDTGVIVDDMSFTMRSTMFANPHYTQNKLKDLVVHVKTMPESPLKKRTLSRVNKPRDDMNFKKKIDVVKTYLKSKISLSKSNQLERTISEIDVLSHL